MFLNSKNEEYNSFIYIWIDCKFDKFYIGSHFGSENDGYLFGGLDIKTEYYMRPMDFHREILSYHTVLNTSEIREIEKEYLIYHNVESNDLFYNRTNESYGGFHRMSVEKRLRDIDADGLNSFQRSAKKMVETRLKRDNYKSAKVKEFKTKKENGKSYDRIRSKISKSLIGSKWINKDGDRKYIKGNEIDEYLSMGWSQGKKIAITMKECMDICQKYNIKSIKEWQKVSKKFNAPYNPDVKYKDFWVSWFDFLGK